LGPCPKTQLKKSSKTTERGKKNPEEQKPHATFCFMNPDVFPRFFFVFWKFSCHETPKKLDKKIKAKKNRASNHFFLALQQMYVTFVILFFMAWLGRRLERMVFFKAQGLGSYTYVMYLLYKSQPSH
jgi:hypothetical protein